MVEILRHKIPPLPENLTNRDFQISTNYYGYKRYEFSIRDEYTFEAPVDVTYAQSLTRLPDATRIRSQQFHNSMIVVVERSVTAEVFREEQEIWQHHRRR